MKRRSAVICRGCTASSTDPKDPAETGDSISDRERPRVAKVSRKADEGSKEISEVQQDPFYQDGFQSAYPIEGPARA